MDQNTALVPTISPAVEDFMAKVRAKNPHEPEYLQAVQEVAEVVIPFMESHPEYKKAKILERLAEPDRMIVFRVPWIDDKGEFQMNRGFRVQMSNAIGPYKGGLRFHPSVNPSILKFLAFEQVFKNSLTMLPMGGGKGGSDFDPKGKSDNEIMSFCQNFMIELSRHIGANTDVPAGDIGVGGREIGFLFGQYKRLNNKFTGVLTGKGLSYGGSLIRPEATGYGTCYFVEEMLHMRGDSMKGKIVAISGSGNVAQFAIEKTIELGGKPVTASDSNGTIYDPYGIDREKLAFIMDLKNNKRGRIKEYAKKYDCEYFEGKRPWFLKCDIALPCATQNEIEKEDAEQLVKNGCMVVAEGANMPSTPEAIRVFQDNNLLYAPGKAANAGGVATSGLEMTQNAIHLAWTRERVDEELRKIMSGIHKKCVEYGTLPNGTIDYVKGANIAGFVRVADAMLSEGNV